MAKITERRGYHVLAWTEKDTGKRRRLSLGKVGTLPRRDLVDLLRAKEYELSTGARLLNANRRPAPRFEHFVRDYLLWHQAEYPDSNYRVAQIIADHLIPEFGLTALNLLTVAQVEAWKTKRRFKVRASTVEKELRVLMAVINRAVALKVITDNPVSIVQAPQSLDSRPHHYYQPDELAKLYEQSSYGPIWRFMANTGLRRGEALTLRRMWITDAVRIQSTGEERTKSGEWRKVPLTDGARAAIEDIKEDGPYLLPRMAPGSLSRAFARDNAAAFPVDEGAPPAPGSLHSLRHTFVCHMLLAGVPIRTVQLYAGHASIATTERYAYQVLKQDPAAALKLAI